MSHQPLAALQHPPQVVVPPLNKNPLQLGGSQRGEDLVVDVGQLDGQLGRAEADPRHRHQDQRGLHQEHDLCLSSANAPDCIARVGYKGDKGLHDATQRHQMFLLPVKGINWFPCLAYHKYVLGMSVPNIARDQYGLLSVFKGLRVRVW